MKPETAWERFRSRFFPVTKHDLNQLKDIIMKLKEAFETYVTAQESFNRRQADSIDSAVASLAGVTEDIKNLNEKISELGDGEVPPALAERVEALKTQGEALATRAEGTATALKALDEQTPPKAPTPTP